MPVAAFATRAWLQPIIRAAAAARYPWTRLYDELRMVEPVYRKVEFGYDYRSYTAAFDKGERLKYVRGDYKPSADLFTEARVGMRKSYKYNVQSEFIDESGGVYSSRSSFVASDTALTRREIEDIVRERVEEIAVDYDCPVIKTTLSEAWHREGELWD